MYDKLFAALRANLNAKITPTILKEMGMQPVIDLDNHWWTDRLASSYCSIVVSYDSTTVLDVIENIISEDMYNLRDDMNEQMAGDDW